MPDDPLQPTRTPARPRTWRASPLVLLAAGLDLAIVHLWLSARIDTPTALLEHLAATVCLCALSILWHRRITADAIVMGGAMLLFGPLGGIGLLLAHIGSVRHRARAPRPAPRADPPDDPAHRVMSQIRQGRRSDLSEARPPSFATVFRSGSLEQQQQAIAAILRHYQPELLPLLKQALTSPVPALRVQAAAVYAKLRKSFETRAKAVLAAADAPDTIADVAAFTTEANIVAQSGFADAETRARLQAAASRARRAAKAQTDATTGPAAGMPRDTAAAVTPHSPQRHAAASPAQPPALKRYSCGGVA